MVATRLHTKYVEKPWGREILPPIFPNPAGSRIGEIWFDGPEGQHPPLLVKYIFTSEKLSVQVHPDDAEALERGLPGGKSECWYILDAEPDAVLGIGTLRPLDAGELRQAALDGSIERLMDWKPVKAGSFYYIPAGTVHAIGPGVTLVEVQQNNDVTYRLYDYGRPRELHLDEGVAVSKAAPYPFEERNIALGSRTVMVDGADKLFHLEMRPLETGESFALDGRYWFVPIGGSGLIDGQHWQGSECWLIDGQSLIEVGEGATALIASI